MKKRVGIYLRVSTDGQTTQNQRRELEAVAARSGWEVVDFYEDAGISGSNGREKRPGFDQLLNDATAQDQHGRGLVSGSAWPQPSASCWLPERIAGPEL